jgi:hypothetical protein
MNLEDYYYRPKHEPSVLLQQNNTRHCSKARIFIMPTKSRLTMLSAVLLSSSVASSIQTKNALDNMVLLVTVAVLVVATGVKVSVDSVRNQFYHVDC